jgi:hypothetical protein
VSLQRFVEARGARYVSLQRVLCPRDVCGLLVSPGTPLSFDRNHFTPAAADRVAHAIGPDIAAAFPALPLPSPATRLA